MSIRKKPRLFIGIDPAFRENGFAMAVIDLTDKTIRYIKFKRAFLDFAGWLLNDAPINKEEVVFSVENSNKGSNKKLFRKYKHRVTGARLSWKQAKFIKGAVKMNEGELISDAMDVGKNMGVSQMVVQSLQMSGFKVLNLSPKEKGAKWLKNEILQMHLKSNKIAITKARTNQDERDAAKMAIIALHRWYEAT